MAASARKLLTIRVDSDFLQKVRVATVSRDTTMATVVREALEAWLASNPPIKGAKKAEAKAKAAPKKAAKAAKPAKAPAKKAAPKKAAKPAPKAKAKAAPKGKKGKK